MRLLEDRAAAERELLAAVLANPLAGFDAARAIGVTAGMIADDLCRHAWLAIAVKRHVGELGRSADGDRYAVLALARDYRVAARQWDERDAAALADLALSWFTYLPAVVEIAAARLLPIVARIDELSQLEVRRRQLLAGEGEGW